MEAHEQVDILLVEDNPLDAELTMRGLQDEKLAHKVVWLKDGQQALDYLFRKAAYAGSTDARPRLILLDLKMPRVDGLELLRDLRADPRTRSIPVVVLTSSGEPRDLAATYELLVNSYVIKPIVSDEFARVIGDLGRYWTRVNSVPTA